MWHEGPLTVVYPRTEIVLTRQAMQHEPGKTHRNDGKIRTPRKLLSLSFLRLVTNKEQQPRAVPQAKVLKHQYRSEPCQTAPCQKPLRGTNLHSKLLERTSEIPGNLLVGSFRLSHSHQAGKVADRLGFRSLGSRIRQTKMWAKSGS